jgi:enediyne biosynthesis protein E4
MVSRDPTAGPGPRPYRIYSAILVSVALGCSVSHDSPSQSPTSPTEASSATGGREERGEIFSDRTLGSGIDFTYRNGEEAGHYSILESLGGGVALIDYDGDGLLDIFVTGGGYFDGPDKKQIKGYPCKLYKNLGNFRFQDVTAQAGLDIPWFYSHGCAVADYDNDGWPDLLVTGWGRLALFHNEPDGKGGRHFVEVTRQAGLTDNLWSTSAAWADLDGDGFPDLYVCHYVDWSFANNPHCDVGGKRSICPPLLFKALPHVLYKNNGDGMFTDVSKQAGLLEANALENGKALGVLIVDLDEDGKPDIYVADDSGDSLLYLNQGGMRFKEVGLERGVARNEKGNANGSMGVDAADYDGSGHLSLFVTNFQNQVHALYRNRGRGEFTYASRQTGIASLVGGIYVGWGTGFIDYDRDGAEDIFITNGHTLTNPPPSEAVRQRPILLRNTRQPGHKSPHVEFENATERAGSFFQLPHRGRGAAFGDLDNDGRIDIVVSHLNEPVVLLQNVLDNGNHWLGVELVGHPYRDAVGAKLTLKVGDQQLIRVVKGGGSYLSANDRRVIFGLGPSDQSGLLTVRWPTGTIQTWKGLAIDRYWRLVEGQSDPESVPAK